MEFPIHGAFTHLHLHSHNHLDNLNNASLPTGSFQYVLGPLQSFFYWFIYSERYIDGDWRDHKLNTITIMHSEVALLCVIIQGENLCEKSISDLKDHF